MHKLTIVGRIILWLLLIVAAFSGVANMIIPPTVTYMDNPSDDYRFAAIGESFVKEYMTFHPKDITYVDRIIPFLGSNLPIESVVDISKVNLAQKVIDTWTVEVENLVGDLYQVYVVVSVDTQKQVVNEKGEDVISRELRHFGVIVPLEVTANNSILVAGAPSISPLAKNSSVQGIKLVNQLREYDPEIMNVINNFLEKFSSDSEPQDLRNFVVDEFPIKPLNKFGTFYDARDFRVYRDADYPLEDGEEIRHFIVHVKTSFIDNTNGFITHPDIIFKMSKRENRYFISWMSYKPHIE